MIITVVQLFYLVTLISLTAGYNKLPTMKVDCLQESQDTTVMDNFDGDIDHSSSASPCVKLRINP